MVLEHKHVAALAVFVVLVVVGSGFLTQSEQSSDVQQTLRGLFATGNVAVSNPTAHGLNLYINSVDFPAKFPVGSASYHGTATVTNTGSQSVTSVYYRLDISNLANSFYQGRADFVHIGAGETKTFDLAGLDLDAGTYRAVFKLDTEDSFVETDETDNTYTTVFTVTT